tara:strand:- start:1169 stop:3025 length:1857 start_codon:yes stop_codon:yes gene_type:complete
MKRIKLIGIVLFGISALFLSSCSNSPENLKVIPEETNVVSVIDIYSIIKKGKLDEISELKFFKTFKKEIRNENKKVSKIIDNVIEDPTITGIDFSTDVFAYYVNEANDEKFISFSAEIKNQEKFAEFIEDALDDIEIEFDIEKEKNYSYTLIGNEAVIGWDEKKAVLLIAENYKSRGNLDLEVETLFELKEENQITAKEEFNKFYSSKKDISVWLSTNLLEDNYDFKKIEKDFDITDNYISAYLNFEDNNISLLTQFTPNSEIQKMMEENDVWNNTFNKNLLNYFPKKSFATASFSISPMAYYNILEQEDGFENIQKEFERETELDLKDLFENIKGNAVYSLFGFENVEYTYMAYGYGFNENEAELLDARYDIRQAGYLSSENKELLNQGKTIQATDFSGKYCINIKNIIDNGGTIETAIENNSLINWYKGGWDYGRYIVTTKEEYLPLMGLVIDINDKETVEKLISKIPEDEINKRNDYYEFTIDNRYPSYFSFNENICFITNDKKSIKAFKDGGYSSNNLGSSDHSSGITNSNLYSFLNLNYDEYPKDIKKEIKNNQNDNEEKIFKIWNDFAKSIELKQVDNNSIEIIFNTKENESNSLNTIISSIDDNYKYFMSL